MKKVLSFLLVVILLMCTVAFVSCDDDEDNKTPSTDNDGTAVCKHDDPTQILVVDFVAPTCQEMGLTEGKKCNLCGVMVVPQMVIEKAECIIYGLMDDGTYCVDRMSRHCTCVDIVIPESYNGIAVTSIKNGAFIEQRSLTSIVIPKSVVRIGGAAFEKCELLKNVYYEGNIEGWLNISYDTNPPYILSYGANLYINGKLLEELIVPNTITSINPYSFCGCSSLTSVVISDSVTSIGERAFSNCTSLESITIGRSVTSIGLFAFLNCTSLERITISNSVTTISGGAFASCISLTFINFEGTIAQWKDIDKRTAYGANWNSGVPATEVICSNGTVPLN